MGQGLPRRLRNLDAQTPPGLDSFENPSLLIFQRHWQGHIQRAPCCRLRLNCSLLHEALDSPRSGSGCSAAGPPLPGLVKPFGFPIDWTQRNCTAAAREAWSQVQQAKWSLGYFLPYPAQTSSSSYRMGRVLIYLLDVRHVKLPSSIYLLFLKKYIYIYISAKVWRETRLKSTWLCMTKQWLLLHPSYAFGGIATTAALGAAASATDTGDWWGTESVQLKLPAVGPLP